MQLNYVDEGEGDVIVALHGMAGSLRYWEGLSKGLSTKHRLIRLDLLGFGHSNAPTKRYRLEDHLDAIEKTLEHLKVDSKFTLVGHSMGALLALQFAKRHPDKLKGLVLLSMPVYKSADEARDDITKSKKRLILAYYGLTSRILCTTWCYALRPISKRVARLYMPDQPTHVAEDSVLHSWQSYTQSMKYIIEQQDAIMTLPNMHLPIELIYGNEESKVVLQNIDSLELPTNVRLSILAGGHNIPLEQSKTVAELILHIGKEVIPSKLVQ